MMSFSTSSAELPGKTEETYILFSMISEIFSRHGDVGNQTGHYNQQSENVHRYSVVYRPTRNSEFFILMWHIV